MSQKEMNTILKELSFFFFEGYQMSMIFPCESKEEAFKIMELIEENKKEVTQVKEIDNFKDALEYALKIVKG